MAPKSAPMTVPSPPVSSVPPITAEAMAANMISVPPDKRIDRADAEGVENAGEAAEHAAEHEIAGLDDPAP